MFRKNRNTFDKINKSTKMIGGALYRQEVETPKKASVLSTPIFNSIKARIRKFPMFLKII